MAANLTAGTISINLRTNAASLSKGLLGAGKSLDKFGKKIIGGMAQVAKYGAMASGAALGGLALLTKHHLKAIDASAKFADSIGVDITALQGLQHAATLSGVSQRALNKGIQRMVVNLDEAKNGIGPAAEALGTLNLKAEDLANMSADEAVAAIADRMGGLENASQRNAVAFDIFGKSGLDMQTMLASGGDGIRAMTQDAKDLGLTLSRTDAAKVEAANDSMARIGVLVKGVGQKFTVGIAPYINALADMFADGAKSGDGYQSVVDKIINVGLTGITYLLKGWNRMQLTWQGMVALGASLKKVFFDIADTGYTQITRLSEEAGNITEFIGARFSQMGSIIGLVWGNLKLGFALVVQFVSLKLKTLLQESAGALRNVKGMSEMANTLDDAANTIGNSAVLGVKRARDALKETTAEYDTAGLKASTAAQAIGTATGKVHEGLAQLAKDSSENAARENDKYWKVKDEGLILEEKLATALSDIRTKSDKQEQEVADKSRDRRKFEIKQQKEVVDAEAIALKSRQTMVKGISTGLGDLMKIGDRFKDHNKAAFIAYQGLAASQAGVNAWLGYSQVMADPTIQPTWLKTGMASVSLTAGLVAVQEILGSRALGGPVNGGGLYEVAERGPELLTSGDRTYLMTGKNSGKVTSNEALRGRSGALGNAPTINVYNYSNEKASVQSSSDGRQIDIIVGQVDSAIASGIGNGTNNTARAIERTYGVSRGGRLSR